MWTDEKQRWKGSERTERLGERSVEEKESEARRCRCAKGPKVAKHCVFPMFCGSGGSKSRFAKAAGAEPAGHMRDEKLHAVVARSTFPSQNVEDTPGVGKCTPLWREPHFQVKMYKTTSFGQFLYVEMSKKCTPLWREAHVQVKMYKTHQLRTIFTSWDVEKVHAVVARSTCPSQNVQNTPASDNFYKLRCRKSARRCGAKHISNSKCTKHTRCGPRLAVEMSKKCTPLWREPHFQVKMYKPHQVRTSFGSWDVEKVHAVAARSTFRFQHAKNTRGSDHFWRCRKSACRCGAKHISKSKSAQCGVWSVKCWVRGMKCGVEKLRVKCGLCSAESEMWSVECEVWSGGCGLWSVKCAVWSVKCDVWSVKCGVRNVMCEAKGQVETGESEVWNVKCEMCSGTCEVWSANWSVECGSGECELWRSLKCEVWSVRCGVLCAVCGLRSAVCRVRCVGCGVWCVVCDVRCAVCCVRTVKFWSLTWSVKGEVWSVGCGLPGAK